MTPLILSLLISSILFCFIINGTNEDVNWSDVSLVHSPSNNSQLHFILNDTNSTSSILLFNQNIDLPSTQDSYFLCFQLFVQTGSGSDGRLNNEETELKCHRSIPDLPFNITDLVNGTYQIQTSLLLVSKSNLTDMTVLKRELTVFHIKAMIDFHATYEWSQIEANHAIMNGLDIKMDIFGNQSQNNAKLVRIPPQWVLQLFISSEYRLLWLYVSKSTRISSIKYEISVHTGMAYECIDIVQNSAVLSDSETIESTDWFYHKYDTFVGLDSSLFCQPIQCGFGYLNTQNRENESSLCDYKTLEYKAFYAQNKGKMWIDLSNAWDSLLTLPPNL